MSMKYKILYLKSSINNNNSSTSVYLPKIDVYINFNKKTERFKINI